MKRIIPIVLAADDNYAIHLGVCMSSILKNSHKDTFYDFFILDNNISKKEKDNITSLKNIGNCNIQYIDISKIDKIVNFSTTKFTTHVSKTALAKFEIPNLITKYDKILYLDSDIIVLKDLVDLYDQKVSDKYAAAVKDKTELWTTELIKKTSQIINFSSKEIFSYYFNSGVMLLNLDLIRKNNIMSKAVKFNRINFYNFVDQNALNHAMKRKVLLLKNEFNFQVNNSASLSKKELKNYYVIHFCHKIKPWDNTNTALARIYWQYRQDSPWKIKNLYLKFIKHKITDNMSKFFYQNKTSKSNKQIIKICKIPIYIKKRGCK